jgi:hypothetical protein
MSQLYVLLESNKNNQTVRVLDVFDAETNALQGLRSAALDWAKKEVGENHLQDSLDSRKPLSEFEDGLLLRYEDPSAGELRRITVYRKRTQVVPAGWLSAESKQVELAPCFAFYVCQSASMSISAPEQLRSTQRQMLDVERELRGVYEELAHLSSRYQQQRAELVQLRKKLSDAEARSEQLEAYAGVKTVRNGPNSAQSGGLTLNVLQELCSVLQTRGLKQ